MLWGMQGAWWNCGARCCRLVSGADVSVSKGVDYDHR